MELENFGSETQEGLEKILEEGVLTKEGITSKKEKVKLIFYEHIQR